MLEDISLQSWLILGAFAAVSATMIVVFLRFEKAAKDSSDEITRKMDEVEREYVRLKPEVDELKYELSTKVDYDYLETKMHELVGLLAEHASKREEPQETAPVAVTSEQPPQA